MVMHVSKPHTIHFTHPLFLIAFFNFLIVLFFVSYVFVHVHIARVVCLHPHCERSKCIYG